MSFIRKIVQVTTRGYTIITDWLLIVLGIALVLVSIRAIDVLIARYVVAAFGIMLAGVGWRFRTRRISREKENNNSQ